MEITKRVEFDYGHRIPSHSGKCRSPHGHRGVLEVTLNGHINPISDKSNDGMVLDFSDVKTLINTTIVNMLDHAFLIWEGDKEMLEAFALKDKYDWKIEILSCIPTAENLAQWIYNKLYSSFRNVYNNKLEVSKVRFYETPNSWADATAWEIV